MTKETHDDTKEMEDIKIIDNKEENENKKNKDKDKKHGVKIIISIIIIIAVIELAYGGYMLYEKYKNKFKDATIEIGSVSKIDIENFLIDERYKEDSLIITDLNNIDLSKVGEYKVHLSHLDKEEDVTLRLVDSTPPKVEFQDITKYINYKPIADDFIIKKEDLLYNTEADGDLLDISKLKEIANSDIGDYELITTKEGVTIKTIVKVTDLTPPTLKLKNISIYDDEIQSINGKDSFIVSTFDASGEVTTTLKTELNLSKIGTQEVIIEAVDKYGNNIEKTANLTIKKDTTGPVISGLSQITIARGKTINLESGVFAKDDRDGNCAFQVDGSKVNTNVAGTYYATYTSKDKRGNVTTKKRKIVVNHNQEDTENKFNEYYNQNLAGKSVLGIVQTIRDNIRYNTNWGGDDPIWYGLTNRTGNCYVHAMLVKKALDKKGISNMIIHTTDKTHYWNLVNEGGKYAHYDSTPGSHIPGPATDEEKFNSSNMKGRNWDRNAYPKAE